MGLTPWLTVNWPGLALTNLSGCSICTISSKGYGKKIHPTQKPVALYSWIFDRFTQPGMKILDTHLGSGSIALAAHDHRLDLDAWEIDEDYHRAATSRLDEHQRQGRLF